MPVPCYIIDLRRTRETPLTLRLAGLGELSESLGSAEALSGSVHSQAVFTAANGPREVSVSLRHPTKPGQSPYRKRAPLLVRTRAPGAGSSWWVFLARARSRRVRRAPLRPAGIWKSRAVFLPPVCPSQGAPHPLRPRAVVGGRVAYPWPLGLVAGGLPGPEWQ